MGKKKLTWDGCWTTDSEIEWLKTIGDTIKYKNTSKLVLLKKYRKSLEKRSEWGSLKKEVLVEVVEKMIREHE